MNKLLKLYSSTNLILRIAVGIAIGTIMALLLPQLKVMGYLGTLFIGALKAMAPILVFFLVASSISKAGSGIGKKFKNVILLYLISTLVAAFIAVIVNFLAPVTVTLDAAQIQQAAPESLTDIFENLLKSLVENPVRALVNGNYLGILMWAIVLGFGLKAVNDETTNHVLEKISEVLSMTISGIIQLAPLGIMGIVFTAVSTSGLAIFTSYGKLVLQLVLTMLFVMLVSNPLIMFLCTKKNPYPLIFTCIRESAISAFFTRSSAANIPINMKLCEKLGLDKEFYSVSIPLGSTINMDGAAVVITIMSLTLAHTLGINVPVPLAILLAVISTLGACGTSGVAGGSLLLIPMACSLIGISSDVAMQMVAVGFIISVIQDSLETALNSSSDVAFTATAELMAKEKNKTN